MAKAAKSKKAPKRKPAKKPAAKAKKKKVVKAAKSAKSKAAARKPKSGRKVAAKGKVATKNKAGAKGKAGAKKKTAKLKTTKRTVTAAKAKPAPKRKPVAAKKPAPKPARKVAKAAPARSASGGPRFENATGFVVAGLSGRYSASRAHEIPSLWQRFSPHEFGRVPGQVGEKFYGVCYNFDGQGNFDYAAAVEVDGSASVPTELAQVSIPAGRYAVFPHAGHVSALSKTWMDIYQKWLPSSGRKMAQTPSFELYSESFDPEVGTGGMEIWIPLAE